MNKFLLLFLLLPTLLLANLPPTTSKIDGDASKKTTFDFEFPNFSGTHTGTKVSVTGATNLPVSGDITLTGTQFNSVKVGEQIARDMTTGVADGALLSINADPTKFNISDQVLTFSDYSVSLSNPVVKAINCPALTGVSVTNLATADSTYVSISPTCTVIQSTTFPTPVQRRTNAFVGRLSHINRTSVTAVASLADLVTDTNSQLYDLLDSIGAFNISGNVITPNGANLSFNRSAGSIFRRSANYPNNKQNPHMITFAGATASNFLRSTQNSTNATPVNTIDVANYDVGGTVTAIPGGGGTSTNRRVYIFSTGTIAIQYGQVTYSSLANAIAGVTTESFVVNPQLAEGGILLAVISCRKDATALNNSAQCQISPVGRFDQTGVTVGSLATTTLQQAYDNSATPQITTSSAGGSVDIKRGSAADTDSILRGQNGSGVSTFDVTGDGRVKSLSKLSGDNVFRDSNLLTNPSFEHPTIGTGWTFVNGSCNSSAGVAVDGNVNCSFTSTGSNWSASQCSTTNAARLAGQEMENSVWLGSASTTDPIWVCPGTNGSYPTPSVANGCMQYTNIGSIQLLKNYFLGDSASTSNCIRISGSNSGTTVGIDKAYTGLRTASEVSGQINSPITYFTPTISGVSTSASICSKQRNGPYLLLDCRFTSSGAGTGVNLAITLPDSLSISSSIPSAFVIGKGVRDAGASANVKDLVVLGINTGSAIGFSFAGDTATTAPTSYQNGSAIISGSGQIISFQSRIPIAEWQNNINAFSLKCDDPRECETVFSADIAAAGAVTFQNTGSANPWINGSCTVSTGVVTCNLYKALNDSLNCTGSSNSAGGSGFIVTSQKINNSQIRFTTTSGGTPTSIPITVVCQKQGNDYLNSRITQQIVQMREVPRTPGESRIDTFSFSYGTTNATTACSASPCSYLDQIGNLLTNVTRSGTGSYSANLIKTYLKLKCAVNPANASFNGITTFSVARCENCNSVSWSSADSTTARDSYGTVICQGVY